MEQPLSAKRGEGKTPPFFIAAVAAAVLFSVTGAAFAAATSVIVLTLDQAIDLAMKANRNIANSRYGAESRRYSIDAAQAQFDLKLIPAGGASLTGGSDADYSFLSAGLQLQKKLEYGTSVSVGPQVTRSSWGSTRQYTTDMNITVTQPLLRGMGKEITTDGLRDADSAYRTSLRNVYQVKVNTVLETISTYYDATRQGEMRRLFENMGTRLKGHSEIARAKEKVGLATPMDTYRAEIPLKEAEDAMITASEAFRDAKDRLKLILALPQNTELEVTAPETPDFREMPLDDAVDTALKNRVEMEQVNQDMAEARRKADIMRHNILPDLNLVLGYGRFATEDTLGKSAGLDLDHYSVSLQSGADIFRTAEKAAYQQSLINVKMIDVNAEGKKEEIRRQVRKQWLSLKEAVKRVEIRKAQIRQGEEKIALAEVKFAHGMANNFDVIEAEKELQGARGNLLAARIDYAVGIYNMKAAMGVLIPGN